MRTYLGLFVISAVFTLLITPLIKTLSERWKAYGAQETGRATPAIPRLGGLAIFVSSLAAWCILLFMPNDVGMHFRAAWGTWVLLLLPAILLMMAGVVDDLQGLSVKKKFIVQIVAAMIAWYGGFRITLMPILGYRIEHPLVSFFLTCLWIVAVTNSLNLIDGLDGLAAGIAFFAMLCMFIVSLINWNYFTGVITITLAGALLAFLKFNFMPATIYLGDTGSLFLGFVLSILAIYSGEKSATLTTIVVPYMALGLPLLDTSLTVVRRFLSGKSLFEADRDHIHHRVLQKSQTPQIALLVLYAIAALFGFGSLLVIKSTGNVVALVAVVVCAVGWFLLSRLDYAELQELNLYVSKTVRSQRLLMANQILIRKASRDMEEAQSLQEVWTYLIQTLETLSFTEARCRLHDGDVLELCSAATLEGSTPSRTDACWMVTIPLRCEKEIVGELQISRPLSEDSLPFQFLSILNTLVPAFERELIKRRFGSTSKQVTQVAISRYGESAKAEP